VLNKLLNFIILFLLFGCVSHTDMNNAKYFKQDSCRIFFNLQRNENPCIKIVDEMNFTSGNYFEYEIEKEGCGNLKFISDIPIISKAQPQYQNEKNKEKKLDLKKIDKNRKVELLNAIPFIEDVQKNVLPGEPFGFTIKLMNRQSYNIYGRIKLLCLKQIKNQTEEIIEEYESTNIEIRKNSIKLLKIPPIFYLPEYGIYKIEIITSEFLTKSSPIYYNN